jgi:hypothetical protein
MNPREQTALLDEIRQKYDNLVSFYKKKPDTLLSFEKRLTEITYSGGNMDIFLQSEMAVVNDLLAREEDFFQDNDDFSEAEPEESFADRILGEMQQKQEKYPLLNIHRYATPEVSRLYGALKQLSETEWSNIVLVLDKSFPEMRNGALVELEHTFHRLIGSRGGNLPTSLERYHRLLDYAEATPRDLQKESQNLIKDASFFLHDLKKFLSLALAREVTREKVEIWLDHINGILSDFRLKEIRRSDQ